MPASSQLQLVIEVDAEKGTAEVKKFNAGLQEVAKHGKHAGDEAGGALDNLIGKIAAGVSIGNLLEKTFEKLVEVAKEYAVESLRLATHNEFVLSSTKQLARVHGLAQDAVLRNAEAVKKLGFHESESLDVVNRMVIAEMDLSRAAQVASLARDAAALKGISREEALDTIMHAVETSRSRALRQMGILVKLEDESEKAELRLGRALSETEKREMNLTSVLKFGANIQGIHAEATKTVEGALEQMRRAAHEAREEIGKRLLPTLQDLVVLLRGTKGTAEDAGLAMSIGLAEGFRIAFPAVAASWDALAKMIHEKALKAKGESRVSFLGVIKPSDASQIKKDTDLSVEQLRKIRDAEKAAHEFLLNTITREFTGIAKVLNERSKQIELHGKSKKAIDDINRATVIGVQKEQHKLAVLLQEDSLFESMVGHATVLSRFRGDAFPVLRSTLEDQTKRFEERQELEKQTLELHLETLDKEFDFESEVQAQIRDARLRNLELIGAQTLRQQIEMEQKRAAIEIDYVNQEAKIHAEAIERRKSRELEYMRFLRIVRPDLAKQIDDRVDAVTQQAAEDARQNEIKRLGAIGAAREQAAVRSAQIVRERLRSTFEHLKDSASRVFDALLTKSESVFAAIGNALKTAVLTAIKEIVSSQVAAMLMRLLYGVRVGFSGNQPVFGGGGGTARGGILGRLGGLLGIGAVPVFGGGVPGLGGFGSPTAPGGTPTLTGAPISGGGVFGTSSVAGVSNVAGLPGLFGGLKNFLGLGSNSVQVAPGVAIARSGLLGNLKALGKSDAALVGGALLAIDGLRRGGALGVTETTAGGALIGYKFGGPIGAAIGAAVGFGAGLIRLFIKGAKEKAREKIRNVYGIDIQSKDLLSQIVQMAKQVFGGDMDVAIRSQQVRDLIELYALATGQSIRGLPAIARPLVIGQSGRQFFETPSFSPLGTPLVSQLDRISAGVPQNAGPQPVIIQLDGDATSAIMRGEAVEVMAQPAVFRSASIRAARSNYGRRERLALDVSPGLVTS